MAGDLDRLLYEGNILNRVTDLETQVKTLKSGTLKVTVLDHITNDIGLQMAGEFRSGNGLEPDAGFTGMRMGYPGFSYAGGVWALAGVNNDTLEFGIDYVTGKAYTGGGTIILDTTGEKFYNGALLTLWLQPDGDIFAGSDLSSPNTTSFALFTNAQNYNGEAIAAGSQMLGSNTAGYFNAFYNSASGHYEFRGGTTVQAYIGTDGVIYAGGGVAHIDSMGYSLVATDVPVGTRAYKFLNATNTEISGLYGTVETVGKTIGLSLATQQQNNGYGSSIDIDSYGDAHLSSIITLQAIAGALAGTIALSMNVDDSSTIAMWATRLYLNSTAAINEFSTDGTMAGNSDTALPTEKAVVTYVGAHAAGGGGCPARAIMGV